MDIEILALQWTAEPIIGGVFDFVAEVWYIGVGVLIVLGVIIKVVGWFRKLKAIKAELDANED